MLKQTVYQERDACVRVQDVWDQHVIPFSQLAEASFAVAQRA